MLYRRHHNEQICQLRAPTSQTKFCTKGICKVIKYLSQFFFSCKIKLESPYKNETLLTLFPISILGFVFLTMTYLLFSLNKWFFQVYVLCEPLT